MLEHYEKVLGERDPNATGLMRALAMLWHKQEKYQEAEQLLSDALTLLRERVRREASVLGEVGKPVMLGEMRVAEAKPRHLLLLGLSLGSCTRRRGRVSEVLETSVNCCGEF